MGVMGIARLAVQLGEYRAVHEFLVAEELLMPVIIARSRLFIQALCHFRLQQPNGTHSHRS